MTDLDVGRVRAFVSAAEHGSFTRAAAAMFITQQALSKRIAVLEGAGGPLFARQPGGVRLTERGRAFLPVAERLMAAHEAAIAALSAAPVPSLRVDVWGTIQAPALQVGRFASTHPEASVEVSYRKSLPKSLRALQSGEIDAAFGNVPHLGQALPHDLEAEPVLEEVIAGLVHRDDPLSEVTLEAARARGLWFPGQGASPELVSYMRWVGELLQVPVDMHGSNASLALIHETLHSRGAGAIGMTGRDWAMPASLEFRVVPAPVIPAYQWWLVRRRGWQHPVLNALRDWLR